MTDEEFEKLREFTLQRLAESDVRMGRIEENMERFEAFVGRFATITADSLEALASSQIRLSQRMDELAESQQQANKKIAELAEAQAHTDKRLDALIDIVREGRNGKS